jgi:site-specific DNA recombinase
VEQLVTTTIADHLCDPQWLAEIAEGAELSHLTRIIGSAQRLAQSVREPAEEELQLKEIRQFIERIEVGQDSVTLAINRVALAEALEIAEPNCIANIADVEEPIEIAVAIRLQRCGKQVRLILGEVSSRTRSPDGDPRSI